MKNALKKLISDENLRHTEVWDMGKFLIVKKIRAFGEAKETEDWLVNIKDIKRVEPVSCNIYAMVLSDQSIFVSGDYTKLFETLNAHVLS